MYGYPHNAKNQNTNNTKNSVDEWGKTFNIKHLFVSLSFIQSSLSLFLTFLTQSLPFTMLAIEEAGKGSPYLAINTSYHRPFLQVHPFDAPDDSNSPLSDSFVDSLTSDDIADTRKLLLLGSHESLFNTTSTSLPRCDLSSNSTGAGSPRDEYGDDMMPQPFHQRVSTAQLIPSPIHHSAQHIHLLFASSFFLCLTTSFLIYSLICCILPPSLTMQQDDLGAMMRNFEKLHTGERTFHMPSSTLSMTTGLGQPQLQNEVSNLDLDSLPVEAIKEKLAESNSIVNELMWRMNSMNLEIDKVNKKQVPKHVLKVLHHHHAFFYANVFLLCIGSAYYFNSPCFT